MLRWMSVQGRYASRNSRDQSPTQWAYKTMRRLILVSALAASAAFVGACQNEAKPENKPVASPSPIVPASPIQQPSPIQQASPLASPAKPGATPEVKKEDGKNVNKEVKPTATPKK